MMQNLLVRKSFSYNYFFVKLSTRPSQFIPYHFLSFGTAPSVPSFLLEGRVEWKMTQSISRFKESVGCNSS